MRKEVSNDGPWSLGPCGLFCTCWADFPELLKANLSYSGYRAVDCRRRRYRLSSHFSKIPDFVTSPRYPNHFLDTSTHYLYSPRTLS
jgi:hypothetical protein